MVIGMGNVAVDVTRVLCRTADELAKTDIAPYALEALRESRVKDVYMVGRRGPVQAAFTNPELKELGEMEAADIVVRPEELVLDPASQAALKALDDRMTEKNLRTLEHFAAKPLEGKRQRIHLRFLLSPTELTGNGRVESVTLAHNRLVPAANDDLKAEPTGQSEVLPTGLVFRSVGYLGTGLPGLPFDAKRGIIPNTAGRVIATSGAHAPGEFVVGWIKRGPSGVIGTNKPDASETTEALLEDFQAGVFARTLPPRDEIDHLIQARGTRLVSWSDWSKLDQIERRQGAALGRPRVKFTSVSEMLEALDPAIEGSRAGPG